MKHCTYCGDKLPDYAKDYCPNCGKPLPEFNVSVRFDQDITNSKVIVGGVVNITEEGTGECPDCFGTGIEHMKCSRCDGSGQLKYYDSTLNNYTSDSVLGEILLTIKRNIDANLEANYKYINCEKCDGKGRLPLEDPDDLKSFMDSVITNQSTGRKYRNKCPNCNGTKRVRIAK